MRKRIIILTCFALASMALFAQPDAQYTLFPWASLYYNPGTAGEQNNTLCFTGIFANKYTGFQENHEYPDQSPTDKPAESMSRQIQDFLVNTEYYSRKIRGAIGLSFQSDHQSPWKNIAIRLGYTYRMKIAGGGLGIGFQVNLANQALEEEQKWHPTQPDDPFVPHEGKDAPSSMRLDFSLGLHYRAESWDVGVSAVNLLGKSAVLLSGDEKTTMDLARQLYIHGGYVWTLPWDPSWTVEPKVLVKTDFATFQLDAAILARYNGILWGGLSYRINDAVSVLFGARPFYNSANNYLKGLDVGVGYSFTTTKFAYTNKGSMGDIEVMVRYCFDIYKTETFSGYGSTRAIYKNRY